MRRRFKDGLRWMTVPVASAMILAGGIGAAAVPARQAHAQAAPQPVQTRGEEDRLTQPQFEQLLAPIALYPDTLLMQVLMAATYPLEVVQAKRWLGQGQNAALRGDALAQALNAEPWDPSVKSLVPFPDVLAMMNDQLDWTQQLGDAVLAQQEDVMNAVQVLRGRAQASGALQSGPQQTVTVTQTVTTPPAPAAGAPPRAVQPPPQVIAIAPAQPGTVYVPAYDPNVVYGGWPYPQYPPAYYPPPVGWGVGNALLTGMAFASGVAIVGSLWNWATPGWGRGDIDVNVNRYNNINVNRNQITGNRWEHDVSHRHGVAYRNDEVRNRVNAHRPDGARAAAGADRARAREQFRGRLDQAQRGEGIGDRRPGATDRLGPGGRPGTGDRGPGARPGAGDRPGLADRGPVGERDRGMRPGAGDRRPGGDRPAMADRPGAGAQRPVVRHDAAGRPQMRPQPARQGPQGFQGLGAGGAERAAAQRGAASRMGQAQQRAGGGFQGGGARAGGFRGGGGGHRPHGGLRR